MKRGDVILDEDVRQQVICDFIRTLYRLEMYEEVPKACWCNKETSIGVKYTECTFWYLLDGDMKREIHIL